MMLYVLNLILLYISTVNSFRTNTKSSEFRINNAIAGKINNINQLYASSVEDNIEIPINPRTFGLALELDDGTRKSHSLAENTQFVSGFFKGLSNKESFARLVESLYYVYEAMENVMDNTDDINVKSLDFPSLRRLAELEKDMSFYFGEDWKSKSKPSMATTKYVERIKEIGEKSPELLVAHLYTRYLGDLFGGQMMGGMATRSLGLESGEGISFYKFTDIQEVKPFIDEYYTKLNSLDLSAETRQAIVDEANLVFTYNIYIFDELEGNGIKTMFKLLGSSIKDKIKSIFSSK